MRNNTDSLLTKPEAARALRVCIRSLEGFLRSRRLAYLKLGKSVRIERAELDRFKESLTVKAI